MKTRRSRNNKQKNWEHRNKIREAERHTKKCYTEGLKQKDRV